MKHHCTLTEPDGYFKHVKVYSLISCFCEVLNSLGVWCSAPAGPLPGVEPEVRVEVCRLVETFSADVAPEGLLSGVDAVVPLQHADCGEALSAH